MNARQEAIRALARLSDPMDPTVTHDRDRERLFQAGLIAALLVLADEINNLGPIEVQVKGKGPQVKLTPGTCPECGNRIEPFKPEAITDAHGAVYEPWSDGWAIGFKVTRDGQSKIVCLNPSSEDDDGTSNVFLYVGTPRDGQSVIYVDLFRKGVKTDGTIQSQSSVG